jgi:hypothetical protein
VDVSSHSKNMELGFSLEEANFPRMERKHASTVMPLRRELGFSLKCVMSFMIVVHFVS